MIKAFTKLRKKKTLNIGHLESIALWNYADIPNADRFYYMASKIKFTDLTTNLISEVFKYWETIKLTVVDTSFLKSSFSL